MVGKTSLIKRYTKNEFSLQVPTCGIEFSEVVKEKGDVKLVLNIMDTVGQERYKSLGTLFYRQAYGALLIFDLANE